MNKLILLTLLAVAAISHSQGSDEENLAEELSLAKSPPAGNRRGKTWKGPNGKKLKRSWNGTNGKRKEEKQVSRNGCYAASMNAMKTWKDIVGNFDKQRKRMEKQLRTAENKNSKNGEFESVYNMLLEAGGGDISALSCAGSTTSASAVQLTELARDLSSCKLKVKALCNTANWAGLADENLLQQCEASTADFVDKAKACLATTEAEGAACACWESRSTLAAVEAVQPCKFNDEAKAVAAGTKVCLQQFAKCRKYEDLSGPTLFNCFGTGPI